MCASDRSEYCQEHQLCYDCLAALDVNEVEAGVCAYCVAQDEINAEMAQLALYVCTDCDDILLTEHEHKHCKCLSCLMEPFSSRGFAYLMGNVDEGRLIMQRQLAEETIGWELRHKPCQQAIMADLVAQYGDDEIPF